MTYSELYAYARNTLKQAGNESSVYEARCLIEVFFSLDRIRLSERGAQSPEPESEKAFVDAVKKRAEGYPLQYLSGLWSFMGRDFYVGDGVLIPRDDTEVAVRTCYEAMRSMKAPRAADLCSGSGIIAVTLGKMLPDADIKALELEDKAYEFLERNISLNECKNVRAVKGDIFKSYCDFADGSLDAIVSNPPYVERLVIPTLQREVQYEPLSALDGGVDGLDFYRCIAQRWTKKLRSGGVITLEIGEGQTDAVKKMLEDNGIADIKIIKDIQELDRVIFGTKI